MALALPKFRWLILGAIAASQSSLLTGIHFAVAVSVVVIVTAVALIWTGLRPRPATVTEPKLELAA